MEGRGFRLLDIALVRAQNYLPDESLPGLLPPAKVAVKKLISQRVETLKLGDLVDDFYRAV